MRAYEYLTPDAKVEAIKAMLGFAGRDDDVALLGATTRAYIMLT